MKSQDATGANGSTPPSPHDESNSRIETARESLANNYYTLQALAEYIPHRLSALPRTYRIGIFVALLSLLVAADPVAAQEFCDDPAGQLLISIETMLLNYGTMLLFLAFLIGVAMWALTPIFAGQSAVGLGMILLSFGAAIAFVVGTQFFGMTFEIAGAGGDSCSTVLS